VLFLDTPEWSSQPEETFIWVVTKSAVRRVRSDLDPAALALRRCAAGSTQPRASVMAANCAMALGIPIDEAPGHHQSPLFDHGRAHRLYKCLFGEVEDLIRGKQLLIVPSGPLTQLPFQVLVITPPISGDHREVD
jgi:hypothetical protein